MAEQRGRGQRPDSGGRNADRGAAGRGSGSSAGRGRSTGGRGAGGSRPGSDRRSAADGPEAHPRSADQEKYDGPPIPEEVTGKELDRSIATQLQSLPEKLGQRVARHLVAAGLLLETDPKTAYEHTLAARARAGRLAVVREAVGEAAYAAGEYAESLQELRAARRMNGSPAYLAIMADCERALKRPDRALRLLKDAPRARLTADQVAELTIVEAGARRDRGEFDAALRVLEQSSLDSRSRAPWVARLRYVYADTLIDAGRREDALEWFHRAEAVDGDGLTDAGARAAVLESGS